MKRNITRALLALIFVTLAGIVAAQTVLAPPDLEGWRERAAWQRARVRALITDAEAVLALGHRLYDSVQARIVADSTAARESVPSPVAGKDAAAELAPVLEPERTQAEVPEPPVPSVDWINEPTGSTVTVDIPEFRLPLPDQLAGSWEYSGNFASNVSVVAGALRWTFRQGFEGGSSPGRAVINDVNDRQFERTYYVAVRVRYSRPWTRHPAADKIIYFGEMTLRDRNPGVQAGQAYCGRVEGGYLGCTVQASQGGPEVCPIPNDSARNFPCGPNEPWLRRTRIDDGEWHLIEIIATGSRGGIANGGLRTYVDGQLQWQSRDVKWSPLHATRFYGVNLDPVWGGGGNVFKPQAEWMEIAALRVSGR
jgi:hypothetical protein